MRRVRIRFLVAGVGVEQQHQLCQRPERLLGDALFSLELRRLTIELHAILREHRQLE